MAVRQVKWTPDGKYSQTSGEWRVTKYNTAQGWRYRLLRNGERLGLYETANEAKGMAHD